MLVFFKKTIQIFIIIVAFFSIAHISLAQEAVSNSVSSVNLNISPTNPRAGDSVILTVSSDLLDLNSSKIVWYIDGVARKESANRSITIKAKSDGQKTNIRVVVQTSDGIIKETSGEISPGGLDLVVEPMSYTMPFYKGKPFFLAEGSVKIVAVPDIMIGGVKMLPKDLDFRWTREDTVLGSNSGKGQNSIIINSSIPVRDINVGVQILDDSGNILAENSKLITLNSPKILFYEDNPLYGILYNRAINGNYYLGTKEELKIIAKPFSFSFLNDAPEESNYVWSVNGSPITSTGKTNEITLRQTATQSGTASMSLDLNNINKINQYVNGSFNVAFGQ